MARIQCIDPDDRNNFIILTEGKAEVYRDVNGVSRLFSPLQQICAGVHPADGAAHPLAGRYERPPALFVSPRNIQTYDGACRYLNQQMELGDSFLNALSGGRYEAGLTGGAKLKTRAASNVFYPVYDAREQIYNSSFTGGTDLVANFGQRTYGPYHIPGITYARSALTGVVVGRYTAIAGYGQAPAEAMVDETDLTFSVGISPGTQAPSSWGSSVVRAPYAGVVPTFAVEAAVSGAGNYLWFRVALSRPTPYFTHLADRDGYYGTMTTVGPYPISGFISYGIAGANVSYGETTLASGGEVAVVEVG